MRNRFRDAGKGRRTILAVTGKQGYALTLLVGENAIAIVFFLVDPAWPVERFTHQSRQHGMHAKWDSIAHWGQSGKICGAGNPASSRLSSRPVAYLERFGAAISCPTSFITPPPDQPWRPSPPFRVCRGRCLRGAFENEPSDAVSPRRL